MPGMVVDREGSRNFTLYKGLMETLLVSFLETKMG
jgi:hypothetical protein